MYSVARAWTFLTLSSLTLVVLGHYYGGREGLLTALVIVLGVNSYVYFVEDKRVLKRFLSRQLEGQDSYGVREIVRRVALQARIPPPQVIVLSTSAPQCGAIGHSEKSAKIILTQGLLDKFSKREVEILITYQILNIKNTYTLAFAAGSFILYLSLSALGAIDSFIRLLIVEKKNIKTYISQPFTRFFSPLIGFILKLSIRPNFYAQMDLLTSQFIGEAKELAIVLNKLDSYSKTLPLAVPPDQAHIFIVTPLSSKNWLQSFVTHPKTKGRIEKLVGYYPL